MSFGNLDFTGTYNPAGGPVDLSTAHQAVTFYQRNELVPFKSEQEGRPIYRTADYIRVETPGDNLSVIDREAMHDDKLRYAKQFEAYKAGKMDVPEGAPLSGIFAANPEIVDTLKAFKVYTVEQLASLSDTNVQTLPMGGGDWVARARRFLDVTKDAGRLGKIEARQRDLDFQNEQLVADNAKLLERLAELEAGAKKGRRNGELPTVH